MASEVSSPSSDVTGSNICCPNSFIIGHFNYSPDKPFVDVTFGVPTQNALAALAATCLTFDP